MNAIQAIIGFAKEHGNNAYPTGDGKAVVIESAWIKPGTGEAGIDRDTVTSMQQARELLGY